MNVTKALKQFLTAFLFFQLLIPTKGISQVDQSGWSLILQNDFSAAKSTFQSALESNPKDEDALTGLMFIAETVQDYKMYKKYSKQLIEVNWDEEQFALFGHLYEEDPEKLLKKLKSEKLKAGPRFSQADSLFQKRKFKAYKQMLRQVTGDYNWFVIGPFTNVSGSGFTEDTPVEKESFNSSKEFKNEKDNSLKWVKRDLRDPDGVVNFTNVLPYSSQGTYYANTFLNVPKSKSVQLRIARTTPLKIWLDDQLIFENRNNIAYNWDYEIVELELAAGTHRLLVKCSNYPDFYNQSTISLSYNDTYDEGDGYRNYKYDDYYSEYSNGGDYLGQSGGQGDFAIRITDQKGKLFQDITSSFEGKYAKNKYSPIVSEAALINHFKNKIKANPQDLKNYYFLCKAYLLYDFIDEGEAWFYQTYQSHQEEVFFKYLLAKFYALNGKGEKAESLISGLDEKKMPLFALMETELSKIDQEKNESEYLNTLSKLLGISPTNWNIITNYLEYYGKKGKTDEKKKFIQDFLTSHPDSDYKKRLEPYLEDDSYKPSSYKAMTDKEREKNAKDALKRMKKEFNVSDYRTVIYYYKQKEKKENVLKLYDELIEIFPYQTSWREEKARFLFENDRLDDALAELQKSLLVNAYRTKTYETIGDIYFEKDDKKLSYDYYKKALDLKRVSSSYGLEALEQKMEKIKEEGSLKEYFNTITFEESLKDQGWKDKYKDEESIILLYTIESALDKDNVIDYSQKMQIYIQNEAGAKYWTEANFGFLGNISFVKVLKKDGKEVSPNRSYGYVVFKNLEPGDIIQIEGNSKASMTRELHGQMYHIASLSHDVPVYKSQMEFIHPKETDMYYTCYRLDCEPEVSFKDDYKILNWEYSEVPKMEYENAIVDDMDAYAWIMFSTQKDWSDIVKWYLRKTYRRLETNYEIENELLGIIEEGMTDEEIVESIYNYLTKEITYSHVSFLNSNYIPKKPSATISDQIGDCKDVASLMIAMLRKYGIEAHYVLVRSSNFTNVKPLPSILTFNHVIVGYVLDDGIMRYLDLTTDYYPNYVIPEFDNNSWALIVKEGETDVFRLPNDMLNQDKSRLELKIDAKIESDRSLVIKSNTVGKGVLGGKLREELNRVTTEDERRKFLINYFGEGSFDHLTIKDFAFENLEDISAPLEMTMDLKAYNYIERVSNFYIVQVPLLNAITTRPTLFVERRYNNLDLKALFETSPSYQDINMEIPLEFTLMELPENILIDNDFGRYEMKFEKTEKGVKIKRSLVWKTRLIKHEDYTRFKTFYLELLDADRLKLALTKSKKNEG